MAASELAYEIDLLLSVSATAVKPVTCFGIVAESN